MNKSRTFTISPALVNLFPPFLVPPCALVHYNKPTLSVKNLSPSLQFEIACIPLGSGKPDRLLWITSVINRRHIGIAFLALALTAGVGLTVTSAIHACNLGGWSDATRQWEVCQYVRAGINPYELAYRLLRDTYGPSSGPHRVRLKEHRIYSISSARWTPQTPGILPGHPPPEATYPPSTMSLLVPTIGILPKPALLPSVTLSNLLCLALLIVHLTTWFRHQIPHSPMRSLGIVATLVLLWPPTQLSIQTGQATLFATLCALLAVQHIDRTPSASGLLFMGALIKPSMVLLFFIIPLIRGRWKPIGIAFLAGLVLTVLPAFWLGEWPWVLISQWLSLCRYVLQGAFTIQEVMNALGWENTGVGWFLVLAIWGGLLAWCVWHRSARWEALFSLLSLGNLAWTYHERHDFVLLAVPLVLLCGCRRLVPPLMAWAGLFLLVMLALAYTNLFYVPTADWARAIRWAGRFSLIGLWLVAAGWVRISHRQETKRHLPESASPSC